MTRIQNRGKGGFVLAKSLREHLLLVAVVLPSINSSRCKGRSLRTVHGSIFISDENIQKVTCSISIRARYYNYVNRFTTIRRRRSPKPAQAQHLPFGAFPTPTSTGAALAALRPRYHSSVALNSKSRSVVVALRHHPS